METRSQHSYLMEEMCFNNFLIRYYTLKFTFFFWLRWWQNWTSKVSENGDSGKREITWKSTEQKRYTKYNHTWAIRTKACFINNTLKLPVIGEKVKRICKELPLTSLLQRWVNRVEEKLWNMSQKLCQTALLKRSGIDQLGTGRGPTVIKIALQCLWMDLPWQHRTFTGRTS